MLTGAVKVLGGSGTGRDRIADRAGVTRTDLDLLVPGRIVPPIAWPGHRTPDQQALARLCSPRDLRTCGPQLWR